MAGPELLVLARHARPIVDAAAPIGEWSLSPEGLEATERMAERLRPLGLARVVSSVEVKARETGAIVAQRLGLPFQTGHDLHEHERDFVADAAAHASSVERFFARPTEVVYGACSADATEKRFTTALDAVVAAHRGERLCVVAHGLVLSLHLAARYDLDAHATHKRLGMPAYVVVETRTKTLVDVVATV